ncbi:MAG TPA: SPOR domain-containing protein [Candidatus Krumholzibacteria bacterium]|nr:SPOR domain-containing protein [Candidatus Krumholzibacteria bacterium]
MKRALLTTMLVATAAAWLSGCATVPSSSGTPSRPASVERASDRNPYDFRSEGKIPPLSPSDAPNEPDVEEMGITETAIESSDAEAPPDTAARAPEPTDTLVDGFRVQVFASADREIAENAARGAQERLGLASYVELDGGVYKVRVGDYAARAQADQALAAVRRHYADAWIVPSKVRAAQRP